MATSVFKVERKLLVMQESDFRGDMEVTGNVTINGTLRPTALDASAIDVDFEDIEAKGSASIASVVAAACAALGSASLTRSASIASALTVGKSVSIASALTVSKTVSVTQSASIASVVVAACAGLGAASMTRSASIASAVDIGKSLYVASALKVNKTAYVTQSASIASVVVAACGAFGSASLTRSASIASALDVTKSAHIASALKVDAGATVLGGARVASATTEGTLVKEIIAGSVSVNTPPFTGGTTGSIASVNAAITGISASHTFLAGVNSVCAMGGCLVYAGACPAEGSVNFYFGYLAGSGGEAVVAKTVTMRYIAFKT